MHTETHAEATAIDSKFQIVTNAIPAFIAYVSRDHRYEFVNDTYVRFFGRSREEIVGRKVWEITGEEMYEEVKDKFDRALQGEIVHLEYDFSDRNGMVRHFRGTYTPDRNDSGEVLGLIVLMNEVTERHLFEEKLRILTDTIPHMIFTADPNGMMDYCNRKWAEFTGHEMGSPEKWKDAFHPDDFPEMVRQWYRSIQTGEPYDLEYRLRRISDGEYRWVWARAIPIRDPQGKIIQWFGTATDIHEQKQNELELKRAMREADAANLAKSNFLANMSHEIRTPLGAILGFSELLKNPKISAHERELYIDTIIRNGQSLTTIIDDILDLSKVEAGRLQINMSRIGVREIIADAVSLFSLSAEEKDVRLVYAIAPEVPDFVISDPVRLRQILINLIGNAVKFTPSGSVSVRARYHRAPGRSGTLEISVTDSGIGISEEDRGILFEPFSQADNSMSRKFGGTGLGLALSRRLARALGGDVVLSSSELDRGSTFTVTVTDNPADDAPTSFRKSEPAKPVTTAPDTDLTGACILVIEDSGDNRLLIKQILKSAGASIETACDGREGVERAMTGDYDLVLMDMQMPVLNGFEATAQLRALGYKKPIVALTAHAMNEERMHSLEAGCDDHLSKPIQIQLLLETIQRLRKRRRD